MLCVNDMSTRLVGRIQTSCLNTSIRVSSQYSAKKTAVVVGLEGASRGRLVRIIETDMSFGVLRRVMVGNRGNALKPWYEKEFTHLSNYLVRVKRIQYLYLGAP